MKISTQLCAIAGFANGMGYHLTQCTIQRNFFTSWKMCACYDEGGNIVPGTTKTVSWNAPDPHCENHDVHYNMVDIQANAAAPAVTFSPPPAPAVAFPAAVAPAAASEVVVGQEWKIFCDFWVEKSFFWTSSKIEIFRKFLTLNSPSCSNFSPCSIDNDLG